MNYRLLLHLLFITIPGLAIFLVFREPGNSAVGQLGGGGELQSRAVDTRRSGEADSASVSATGASSTANSGAMVFELTPEESEVLTAFADWVDVYLAEPLDENRAVMTEEGLVLAKDRREVMKKLIQHDPRAALQTALPMEVRERLPSELHAKFERPVSGRGSLDVFGVVPNSGSPVPQRTVLRRFESGGNRYDVYVYGRWSGLRSTEDVFLHGIEVDHLMAVHDSPLRLLSQLEVERSETLLEDCPIGAAHEDGELVAADTGREMFHFCGPDHLAAYGAEMLDLQPMGKVDPYANFGERSVLVLRVALGEGEVVTEAAAYDTMLEVDSFLREVSNRQFGFDKIHVTANELMLPGTEEDYLADPILLLDDAREAAREEGPEGGYLSDYDFAIVAFPDIGFQWAGLGRIGGKGAWVQEVFSAGVVAHELGHNLGLFQAHYWQPIGPLSSNAYPLDSGRSIASGNVFDGMGSSDGFPRNHFSGNFKNIIGWLPELNIHQVEPDQPAGMYRVYRLDGGAALRDGRRYSLRIINSQHELWPDVPPVKDYWVDFRQLFAESDFAMNGVLIQWGDDGSEHGSHLLNMHPVPWPSTVEEAPLLIGETFVDATHEVVITPVGRGGSAPNDFVDVIVTRGVLAVSLTHPVPDPSNVNPSGEIRVPAAGIFSVKVNVTATGSEAQTVEIFWGDEVLGEAAERAPGVWVLDIAAAEQVIGESRGLSAVVYNEAGNVVRSKALPVMFIENEIQIVAQPATLTEGDTVMLTVSRTKGGSPLESAEFFADGVRIDVVEVVDFEGGEDAGLTFEWVPADGGIFSLYAKAVDDGGLEHTSPTIVVRVLADQDFPYTFTATPVTVNPGDPVMLSVDFGEEEISSVEYLVDGEVVATLGLGSFAFDWHATGSGVRNVKAIVVRTSGAPVESPVQEVTVVMPEIIVTASPWLAEPGQTTFLSAAMNNPAWEVVGVEYWINDEFHASRGGFGGSPVSFVPQDAGPYRVEVRATDGYGNVAIGSLSIRSRATPSLTWEPAFLSTFNDLLAGTSGETRTVLGGANGTILYSDEHDSDSWTAADPLVPFAVRSLTYGNGVYVGVGDAGRIISSMDAKVWEERVSGVNSHLRDVGYHNGIFLAVGDQGVILRSGNGVDWARANSPETNNTLWQTCYGFGSWIAVGQAGIILTSETGDDWTAQAPVTTMPLRGVTFGKGTFVIVGGRTISADVAEGIVLVSFDGVAWDSYPRAEFLTSVTFSRQSFLATGARGVLLGSYDGVQWSGAPTGTNQTLRGVVHHGERFLAYGDFGTVWRSGAVTSHPASYLEWISWHLNAVEIAETADIMPDAALSGSISNLVRYALGFDPWAPVTLEDLPRLVRVSDGDREHFGLNFRRSLHARDVSFVPEYSSDLREWRPLEGEAIEVTDQGWFEEVTVDDRFEPEAERRFFRLNIRLHDPF